jgi:hypothetical protein
MFRAFLLFLLLVFSGCNRNEYSFQRIAGDQYVAMPLKFDGFSGLRDGSVVKAEGHFSDGADNLTMNIVVYLRPPAEFQSGTYQAFVGGQMSSGSVECPSLDFQGGQTALPSVGGTFILRDENNRRQFRIRIPATPLTGRSR